MSRHVGRMQNVERCCGTVGKIRNVEICCMLAIVCPRGHGLSSCHSANLLIMASPPGPSQRHVVGSVIFCLLLVSMVLSYKISIYVHCAVILSLLLSDVHHFKLTFCTWASFNLVQLADYCECDWLCRSALRRQCRAAEWNVPVVVITRWVGD